MILGAAALPVNAFAAAAPAFGAAQVSTGNLPQGLEEIVVTARKREEALQDTPIAVSVISAADIGTRQLDTIAQIGAFVPNMTFNTAAPTGAGLTTPSIYIRGVGSSETSLGTEPGVALYVDDVYLARSVGSLLDLIDVESVQVLRGPQGTLFGRNSVGGAILIRTAGPREEFGGSVELKTGDDERFDISGSLHVPLSDSVRMLVSGLSASRDGYVKNDKAAALGDTDRVLGRGVIEWQASSDLSIVLSADSMRARESASPAVALGFVPLIPGTQIPSSIQAVSNLNGTCAGASVLGNSGNPDCIDQQWIQGPFQVSHGYTTNNQIFDSQGSRPFSNLTAADIKGGSLHATWDFASDLTLKFITAYRELETFWVSNSDHSDNPGIETKNDLYQQQFTQELQLLGDTGRVNWVMGAFYMDEEGENLNVVAFPEVIFLSGGGYTTETAAGFAQASYDVVSDLELTLGLRYTYERKTYDTLDNQQTLGVLIDPVNRIFLDFRDNPVPFVTGTTPPLQYNELTPHASLTYHWSTEAMSYISYSKGYKSGGYEQRLAPGTPSVPFFEPEYVHSYELGSKVKLLDGQLQAGAALFHTDYDALQISVVDGPAPTLTNAGDATIKGVEVEVTWLPAEGASLSAFAGYLDANYDDLSLRAIRSGVTLDNDLPSSSDWQLGVGAAYDMRLRPNLTLRPFVEWTYRSEYYLDSANTSLLFQEGFHLVNAALTLAPTDGRWSLSLSGRNLLDEAYLAAGQAQYNIGEIEGQYARPREWALAIKLNF